MAKKAKKTRHPIVLQGAVDPQRVQRGVNAGTITHKSRNRSKKK